MTAAPTAPVLIRRRDGRGPDLVAAHDGTPPPAYGGYRGLFVRTADHAIHDVAYPATWEREDALAWLYLNADVARPVVAMADWSAAELARFRAGLI